MKKLSLKEDERILLYSPQDEKASSSGKDDLQRGKSAKRGKNGTIVFEFLVG